jgi:hypothetical protein
MVSGFVGTLYNLQFRSSLADPDVRLRPDVKSDGTKYFEYIFVYVDDIIFLSTNSQTIINTLVNYIDSKMDVFKSPKLLRC